MKFRPLHDRVLIKVLDSEEKTKGGHVWFNKTLDGVNTNQLLWNFLSNYSLND